MKHRMERRSVSVEGLVVPRRTVLRGGLAGLAAAVMSRTLTGCGDPAARMRGDAGPLDSGARDAGGADAGSPDAGAADLSVPPFRAREVPTPPALRSRIADLGPLGDADANGVRLPEGFTSRVIATSGQVVAGSSFEWHHFPDGGAVYATEDGGWIYASNSETPLVGGVGAVRFDSSGAIVDAYPILQMTNINCAGGKTPWHTWLSCEETDRGQVFECDPWGEVEAVARPALGVFKHEAAIVDPVNARLYLSEDRSDGCFYRFVPARTAAGHPDPAEGELQVAVMASDGSVTWEPVPDPTFEGTVPTRMQVAAATRFRGGEGLWWHDGVVYLATKGDDRIWAYDTEAATMSVLYDAETAADPILTGVDNVTVSCCGDVLVAEDGGDMQVVAILPSGDLKPLLQVVGHDSSEITGPAFDPSGTRLYFSSQRGVDGNGVTFEVTGPFHEPA